MEKYKNDIISSLFTQKELDELKFTEEELENLVEAELISQTLDTLPDTEEGLDAFYQKIDTVFADNLSPEEFAKVYSDLVKKDPNFLEQIVAVSAIIDLVKEKAPATAEKISLDAIKAEKQTIATEEQSKKLARIKAMIESLPVDENK